jgi:basic membrane protein A
MLSCLLAGCGTDGASSGSGSSTGTSASNIKVGVIYVGDENEGYTEAHMKGIQDMKKALGLSDSQIIEKTNIPEDESCYDAAVDLADQGCNIIFANSFGHEDYIIQAAKEFPNVQFCHATGYQAASSGLSNMHNYFTSVYESRYVSGVVAGLKINQMIKDGKITAAQAKMGYVGAYPYAEVVSGYTSFYLGAKSVCDSVTMEVQYTNSWANMAAEAEVANQLIADGCVLLSQHADTTGAPSACEAKGVPCVGYNVDMTSVAPNTALTSASINWGPYYTYAVQSVVDGKTIDTDWCKGYADNADCITTLNTKIAADGTAAKVSEVESAIKSGTLRVFDTKKFTVKGSSIESLISAGGDYAKYSKFVSNGYFHESEVGSAPSFDLRIDGITELTK